MRTRTLVLAAVAIASSTTLAAQECVGIPNGSRGFFGAGPAGTDGASGSSLTFAYRGENRSVMVTSQSLGVFAHANQQKTRSIQANFKIKALRGCVTSALKWQAWDTEGAESKGWSIDDPDVYWERHSIGGNYDRLRIPVGVSFGRTVNIRRVAFLPYANPFVVFEMEDFQSHRPDIDAPSQSRRSFGGGLETGFAMRAGWFVMRPSLTITNTTDRALSGKKNWADLALHFGVVF